MFNLKNSITLNHFFSKFHSIFSLNWNIIQNFAIFIQTFNNPVISIISLTIISKPRDFISLRKRWSNIMRMHVFTCLHMLKSYWISAFYEFACLAGNFSGAFFFDSPERINFVSIWMAWYNLLPTASSISDSTWMQIITRSDVLQPYCWATCQWSFIYKLLYFWRIVNLLSIYYA